jgi:hypothetical protein
MKYLYHGSSTLIKEKLEPRSSKVIENEKAVFATDSIELAIIFIAKWSDCDFNLGYYRDKLYLMELYPDAFNKFKNVSGYIYKVDKSLFNSDERLGMQKHEFISYNDVSIIETIYITDIYDKLKKSSLNMITFDQTMKAIFDSGLIK